MKKNIYIPQIILALLLTAFCILPTDIQAQTTHEMKGGPVTIPVGAATPGPIKFKNKSKTDFYDFTFVLQSPNGTPLNFNIDTVTINGKTYTESHNTGKFARIEAEKNANGTYKSGQRIPRGSSTTYTINITLTSYPTVPYEIVIQPTSNTASAVMVSAFPQNFGPCGTYECSFPQEAVIANTYQGLVMGEVNTTALPLTQMLIMPQGPFFINDAFLLNAQGLPIPGGLYSPTSGMFTFPQSVMPGDTFGIQMIPDGLVPNVPMIIQTCMDFPPFNEPYFEISGINNIELLAPVAAGPGTRGELNFRYETPLTHAVKYLNIHYRPTVFGDTNIYWIGQNICLEHFTDTMELSLGFDMLPGQLLLPPTSLPLCDLSVTISDTIYTNPNSFGPHFFSPYTFSTREQFWGPNSPVGPLPPITFPGGTLPPLPPRVWEHDNSKGVLIGCNMVNIDLDSSSYRGGQGGPYVPNDYDGDWNACGPVATANSFSWLRSMHADIDTKLGAAFGQGDSAQRKMLAEFSELMDRTNESQVGIRDFIEAKLAFIDKYKLPMKVEYQSVFLVGAGDSTIDSPNSNYGHKARNKSVNPPNPAPHGRISPEFIFQSLKDTCDTEILLQWMKTDALGNITYTNGHYVTVTGVRQNNGNWRIKWKDDANQKEAGGTRQGISDMTVGPQGVIWIPGLDDATLGKCFVEDVITECYDSSVTFNATGGRAFEDSDGSGTRDPGEGGVGGVTIQLIDPITGVVIGETVSDDNGRYLFFDLANGDYYIQIINLPPGYDFSSQNVGTNDSTDSDVNAFGATATFSLNENAESFTDAGLVPTSIVRVEPIIQLMTAIDPATGLMETFSFDQGAMPQLGDHYTNGLTFLPYRKDSLETSKLTENPVDWILVELRSGSDSTQTVAVLPALVMPDGEVRAADDSPLSFHGIAPGNYYVVLHHRNSLSMMAMMPIYLDHVSTQIDFTSASLPIYGTDSRTLLNGKMVMTGGDGNSDGIINAADRSGAWNFRNAVGYLPWDINLDGVVNAADRSMLWNNRNKQQQLP